jgi:hypothetical protein
MNQFKFSCEPCRQHLKTPHLAALAAVMMACAPGLRAATTKVIYDDALENGWQNWSWATVNLSNTSPTHSGKDSISVTAGAYSALYLHNGDAGQWNPTVFNTLVFWINGGTAGGQRLSLVGFTENAAGADVEALTVNLPPLEANTWTEIQTPLASLGVADNPAFSAFYIFNNTGSADPVFYVDDIQLTSNLVSTNSTPTNSTPTNQVIYADALENGWQNWSWATVDLSNTSPTHSGNDSISVSAGAYSALYLHNGNAGQWNPAVFNTLVFWINGGTAGGQQLSLVGLTQSPTNSAADVAALTVNLPPLEANTWTEIQTPLASLGVADNPAFSALWIYNNTGSAQPVFYVDDIELTSSSAPTNSAPTNGVAMGPNDLVIFDGTLNTAVWENWSWATSLNWDNSSPVQSGTRSVAVQLAQYTAVAVHACPPVDAEAYPNFIFWVNGGAQGGQTLTVQATINAPGTIPVDGVYEHSNVLQTAAFTVGPLPANTWQQEIVPLSALGLTGAQLLGDLWIWNTTDANQAQFYLDGMWMAATTSAPPATVANITVDAAAGRHPIDPRIYGTAYATTAQLTDLGAPLNRRGGDTTSRYNWQLNADNKGNDWFFESWTDGTAIAGDDADQFIAGTQTAGAASMVAIPMLKWVANLGPARSTLWSFSVAKYGPQTASDPDQPDAGNGVSAVTGDFITGNDPTDANVPSSSAYQEKWVDHLTNRWGSAANGGVSYYLMDNEPSIWYGTHRDVQPKGVGMDDFLALFVEYASMIKGVDSTASTVGPEEWGWPGYFKSGLDQQNNNNADQAAHGAQNYLPWLLGQLHQHDQGTGRRLIDVFSLHCYPQGGEFSDDVSTAMQLRRNRSTRSLWDTNYVDETWICDCVQLIPRLKAWVALRYPGLQTAITEYNWGAETNINGATAQADILGIFGREGLDMAARWGVPAPGGLAYKACQMYRNYDGNKSRFGDVSVLASGPNPDNVSVFAAQRSSDNALTVMVINKQLTNSAPLNLTITNFNPASSAQAWRLTAANVIARLPDLPLTNNIVTHSLPAQSITLYVLPAYVPAPPPPSLLLLAGPVNGRLELVLGGVAGETCVIQASPDLKTWTPVSTNVLTAPLAPVVVPATGQAGFYRAAVVR